MNILPTCEEGLKHPIQNTSLLTWQIISKRLGMKHI